MRRRGGERGGDGNGGEGGDGGGRISFSFSFSFSSHFLFVSPLTVTKSFHGIQVTEPLIHNSP
jgi:hypothetical protein